MHHVGGFDVVRNFEQAIADYSGAKYGVSVLSCSDAIFLSCLYKKVGEVTIPNRTYPSVPCGIIHAGGSVSFVDEKWSGIYELAPYNIIDGALRFKRGMYVPGSLHCLSFHLKKTLPIGRGGMILTDDKQAYDWLVKARFDGRTEGVPMTEDNFTILGWNMYMSPDQAARGLWLFDMIKDKDIPDMDVEEQNYPDLSRFPIYENTNILR